MEINRRKRKRQLRRKRHIRKTLIGNADRPRLTVSRSHNNICCQVIDDSRGATLVSASTLEKALRDQVGKDSGNRKGATAVGAAVAGRLKEIGVTKVKFDRNGYRYHGRVAALADAVRKEGIEV